MKDKTLIYIKRYLQRGPVALALWRSVEAKYMQEAKLVSPVLDIGCGFGEFAEVFFERSIDVGLDIDYKELTQAIKTNKYISYTLADARKMPFQNNTFKTVLSISTLEHILSPEKVIKEAHRVLKPGGMMVLTIVLDKVSDYIFYGPFLKKLGLEELGEIYTDTYNKVFKHVTLRSRERWEKDITKAGFRIVKSQEIISPKLTKIFDLLLLFAWPSQVVKLLFGKRIATRPRFLDNFLAKWLYKYVSEKQTIGNTLYIVARKI